MVSESVTKIIQGYKKGWAGEGAGLTEPNVLSRFRALFDVLNA